jgi:hypothetical protein
MTRENGNASEKGSVTGKMGMTEKERKCMRVSEKDMFLW